MSSLHRYLFFIFFTLISAFFNTSLASTNAACLKLISTASWISSELSSKWTNIAPIMYYNVEDENLRFLQLKNTLMAIVIFLRIGSCESSSLYSIIKYSYLSSSSPMIYLHCQECT